MAKGILMARHRISGDEAFEQLKAISQRTNTKVRDLAQRIVSETTRPEV